MKGRGLWNCLPAAVMIPLLLVCPAVAQRTGDAASQGLPAQAPDPIQSGIVVETVAKNSAEEEAGLRMGDVLMRWTRGATQGALDTPFELYRIETEQAPFGTILLEGLRGAERQVWSLGPGEFGLTARPNFTGTFLALYQEGQELAAAGKVIECAERWRVLAARLSGPSAPWLPVWLFFHAADRLGAARQWKEADDAYQSALQQAEKAAPMIAGQLLQSWAKAYLLRNDWANAEKYFQKSIEESRRLGDGELGIALSLAGLGVVFWEREDLKKAEEYYLHALGIREKLVPGSLLIAGLLKLRGLVAANRGDLAKAEEYYLQALEIRKKLTPGSLLIAGILNNLGLVAWQRGELAKADEYYLQALENQRKLAPASLDVAESFTNLGIVALDRGDLTKAEEYFRQDLEIQQKLAPDSIDVVASLNNLGRVAQDRDELAKAEEYFRQALEIQQKLAPDSLVVAEIFNNLGSVEVMERGNLAKAQEYYRQALQIQQKLAPGSLDVVASLNNLGRVAQNRDELAKAEEYFRQALEIQQKLAPDSLVVATIFNNLGNEALERKSGDLGKAEQYQRKALAIREKLAPGSLSHAESLAAVASILRERHQMETSAQLYAQAINALDEQTSRLGGSQDIRSGFRARHSAIYGEYIDLLLAQKQPERAFPLLLRKAIRRQEHSRQHAEPQRQHSQRVQ